MNGWLGTLGVAMGSAWLSGINLYAAVATLGLLEHFGLAHLPGDLGLLGRWWVISLAAVLYLIEFVADKVPAVDSLWDAIHTFIRVPAGAVLASAAFAGFEPSVRVAAFLLGGWSGLRLAWRESGDAHRRKFFPGARLERRVKFHRRRCGGRGFVPGGIASDCHDCDRRRIPGRGRLVVP
jgi:hypothetical protein